MRRLVHAVTGKVKSAQIPMSGNPANQDLASQNVPTSLLTQNNL
jgi:hypothetical protein